MRGSRSSAVTTCISDVPGLPKQISMPLSASVWTRASAPFMPEKTSVELCPLGGAARQQGFVRDHGDEIKAPRDHLPGIFGAGAVHARLQPRRLGRAQNLVHRF